MTKRQKGRPVFTQQRVLGPALDELRVRCGYSRNGVAEALGVTLRTWQRWQKGGAPGWAVHLLRIWAGESPWSGWEGWRFSDGEIWPPGYCAPVTPGQVLAVPYRLQIIAALKRRIREFEGMEDQTESRALLDNLQ